MYNLACVKLFYRSIFVTFSLLVILYCSLITFVRNCKTTALFLFYPRLYKKRQYLLCFFQRCLLVERLASLSLFLLFKTFKCNLNIPTTLTLFLYISVQVMSLNRHNWAARTSIFKNWLCKNIRDCLLICTFKTLFLDTKTAVDHDESPPRTPTGNAPSSESDIDISSPNASHDESIAKDASMKDSGSDLSHRPKRRRFHESYNFNMKCPTPGCNSLGKVFFIVCGMFKEYSQFITLKTLQKDTIRNCRSGNPVQNTTS